MDESYSIREFGGKGVILEKVSLARFSILAKNKTTREKTAD